MADPTKINPMMADSTMADSTIVDQDPAMVTNANDDKMDVDGKPQDDKDVERDGRYVNWRTCGAREIILEDLCRGTLSLDVGT